MDKYKFHTFQFIWYYSSDIEMFKKNEDLEIIPTSHARLLYWTLLNLLLHSQEEGTYRITCISFWKYLEIVYLRETSRLIFEVLCSYF